MALSQTQRQVQADQPLLSVNYLISSQIFFIDDDVKSDRKMS